MNSVKEEKHIAAFKKNGYLIVNTSYGSQLSFLKPYRKEKQQTLYELNGIHKRLENEYKPMV